MKRGFLFAASLAALSLPCLAQDQPNFSGTWVIDREKTDPPPVISGRGASGGGRRAGNAGEAPPQITMIITHTGSRLNILRKAVVAGLERVQELKYTTDGAENANPPLSMGVVGSRGQAANVVSRSHWDGNKLVTEWSQTRNTADGDITIQTREVRFLSPDGKELMLETTISGSPRGDMTRKTVFSKQN